MQILPEKLSSVDEEKLVKFWKSSASGFGCRNFFEGYFNIAG